MTGGAVDGHSSPYATGGGGTVFEHRYAATLLASLLAGTPITALGDDVVPQQLLFQGGSVSPVDDLVLTSAGRSPFRVSIGVRHAPALTRSDEPSIPLLRTYLRVVTEHWHAVQTGDWRLALVVASPNPAVRQVRDLTVVARAAADEFDFRARVARPGAFKTRARSRLEPIDALVSRAAEGLNRVVSDSELTWRLLRHLKVLEMRLEAPDESDRTTAVSLLNKVVDGTHSDADALMSQLTELVGTYAPIGALVDEQVLRRDLRGTRLRQSPRHAQAWAALDRLGQRLRDDVAADLSDGNTVLEVDRFTARAELAARMTVAASGTALIVTGEPDVGKSALTLRSAADLVAAGVAVTAVSLRDLPQAPLDLDAALGGRIGDILAGGAGGAGRLLVIDGAEAALADRGTLLLDLTAAALRANMGVVAVTRTEGAPKVREVLTRAARDVMTSPVEEHVVPSLSLSESSTVLRSFPSLRRLESDRNAEWLIGRPGLINLLLRSGAEPEAGQLLSEADVFAAVWAGLVRREQQLRSDAVGPDQREEALVAVARRELLPGSSPAPDPAVLPTLRSDGLLRAIGQPAAFSRGERCANDLIRDFALVRVLLTDGWSVLREAGAPRWAIRAVRLTCQVMLRTADDLPRVWRQLDEDFVGLAEQFGRRWTELPLEALLTLGDAGGSLGTIWPTLTSGDGTDAQVLVRLCLQRYTTNGIGDAHLLAPVVAHAFDGSTLIGRRWHRRSDETDNEQLVLVWLRGLLNDPNSNPLRQRIRGQILRAQPTSHDEFAVEAIGSLGADLDDASAAFLQGIATEEPSYLWPAVETVGGVLGMTAHRPSLALELAEAYYVDRRVRDRWVGLDKSIRSHRAYGYTPQAAWWYGPFFQLLKTKPVETLAMINRMLDHAAEAEQQVGSRLSGWSGAPSKPVPGLDLGAPGGQARRYVGKAQLWSWYRGTSGGPPPCTSALLAVERFADQLADTNHVPLARIVALLLQDCHNLAMPGMVVGFLVRHLDDVGDLLDPWLAIPAVWDLEFSRSVGELVEFRRSPDDTATTHGDRRRLNLRDVAAHMTVTARLHGDEDRVASLGDVADRLSARAHEETQAGPGAVERLAVVEGWAASLRPTSYTVQQTEEGVVFQYDHPQAVADVLAPSLADLNRTHETMRLENTYGTRDDRIAPVETLADDIAVARSLAETPPVRAPRSSADPLAAVAAAAVVAHAHERAHMPSEHLHWAVNVLLRAVVSPERDNLSFEGTMYSRAADRSGAAALPLLLDRAFDGLGLDRGEIAAGLRACSTSLFDEVRVRFAYTGQPIWTSPCNRTQDARCRHQELWSAALEGLRDSRLGDWDPDGQRRLTSPLTTPFGPALAATETEALLVNRLAPVLATAGFAVDATCLAPEAEELLAAVADAHRRGADYWARELYGGHDRAYQELVAYTLVSLARRGRPETLAGHVQLFASNAHALEELLSYIATLFTYEPNLRVDLEPVWRVILTTALDALDAGADLSDRTWGGWAIGGLLPTPQLRVEDMNPDHTLNTARQDWMNPDKIADLVARWLPYGVGQPKAVDAIASLAVCGPLEWQRAVGLRWAEQVVGGRFGDVANRAAHLTFWLEALNEAGLGAADNIDRWRRLVDGLAAFGDRAASALQQIEE